MLPRSRYSQTDLHTELTLLTDLPKILEHDIQDRSRPGMPQLSSKRRAVATAGTDAKVRGRTKSYNDRHCACDGVMEIVTMSLMLSLVMVILA